MILPTNHLRCHITRCTRSVRAVLRAKITGNSQVGDSRITALVQNDILRFYVSMNDIVVV
jgi:hypothetical protein